MQIDTMSESSRDAMADQYPETPRANEIFVCSNSNIRSISQNVEVHSEMDEIHFNRCEELSPTSTAIEVALFAGFLRRSICKA